MVFPITVKEKVWDFADDSVVKNSPTNAGDMVSIPGPGRSHMLWGKLGPQAPTTEPTLKSPCSATREAMAMGRSCTTTKKLMVIRCDLKGRR